MFLSKVECFLIDDKSTFINSLSAVSNESLCVHLFATI